MKVSMRGMSLIELMVAVAVASIVFLAMTNIIASAVKSLKILQRRIEITQQARLVLARMSRELASAFHPYGMYTETGARTPKPWLVVRAAAVGGEEISFTGNLNQMKEFFPKTTAGGAPIGPYADLTEVHYHVLSSGTPVQTHLYRRQDQGVLGTIGLDYWATGGNATNGGDIMIGQYVRSLDYTVWDKDGAPAAGSATYSYTGAELGFPSRVRMKVVFYDPDNYVDDMTFIVDVSTMRNTTAGP